MTKLGVVLFGCLVAMACGGNQGTDGGTGGGTTTGGTGGNNSGCTITLSGAVSGTYGCDATPTASWSNAGSPANEAELTFGFNLASPDPSRPSVNVGVGFAGEPTTTKTYSNTDTGARQGVHVTTPSQDGFSDVANGIGSWTVSFSSVTTTSTTADGKVYAVHGTLDSMCPTASANNIGVHATF
jgi:hypothetical protein